MGSLESSAILLRVGGVESPVDASNKLHAEPTEVSRGRSQSERQDRPKESGSEPCSNLSPSDAEQEHWYSSIFQYGSQCET